MKECLTLTRTEKNQWMILISMDRGMCHLKTKMKLNFDPHLHLPILRKCLNNQMKMRVRGEGSLPIHLKKMLRFNLNQVLDKPLLLKDRRNLWGRSMWYRLRELRCLKWKLKCSYKNLSTVLNNLRLNSLWNLMRRKLYWSRVQFHSNRCLRQSSILKRKLILLKKK